VVIVHGTMQRADLGAVELVGVVVGMLPVGGGVGLGNRGGYTVAVRNRFRQAQPEGSGAQGLA
jgi:hypothetical protein